MDSLWKSVSSVSGETQPQSVTSNNCVGAELAYSPASFNNVQTPDGKFLERKLSIASCDTSEGVKESSLLGSCKEPSPYTGFTSDVFGCKENEDITSRSSPNTSCSVVTGHRIVLEDSEEEEKKEEEMEECEKVLQSCSFNIVTFDCLCNLISLLACQHSFHIIIFISWCHYFPL